MLLQLLLFPDQVPAECENGRLCYLLQNGFLSAVLVYITLVEIVCHVEINMNTLNENLYLGKVSYTKLFL